MLSPRLHLLSPYPIPPVGNIFPQLVRVLPIPEKVDYSKVSEYNENNWVEKKWTTNPGNGDYKKFDSFLRISSGIFPAKKSLYPAWYSESGSYEWRHLFPIYPEISAVALHYLNQIPNGRGCEIAGGLGPDAMLWAFTKIQEIRINDRNDLHPRGSITRDAVPEEIRDKITFDRGDTIEFLSKPEFKGTMNLLLCRNFIDLLPEEKQSDLLEKTHRVLQCGGLAIFSANVSRREGLGNIKEKPSTSEIYTEKKIAELMMKYGFQVLETCSVGEDGHRTDKVHAQQVVVIAKKIE